MPSIPLRNEPRASGDPMKTTVEYRGRIFDENSDLLAEVRDAVKGYGPPWLRSDLPQPWAVADWGQAFAGTELGADLLQLRKPDRFRVVGGEHPIRIDRLRVAYAA